MTTDVDGVDPIDPTPGMPDPNPVTEPSPSEPTPASPAAEM